MLIVASFIKMKNDKNIIPLSLNKIIVTEPSSNYYIILKYIVVYISERLFSLVCLKKTHILL